MRTTRIWIFSLVSVCFLMTAVIAWAQSRKAGLWEVTTTMTWQQSPMPQGMTPPPNSPFGGGPHTTKVCVTQAMIDKFGGPMSQQRKDCTVDNVKMGASGMSAEMTCTGQVNGKGTFEATWIDAEHTSSKVHFTGTMSMGPQTRPIEWTSSGASTFVSADCGSVKPVQ